MEMKRRAQVVIREHVRERAALLELDPDGLAEDFDLLATGLLDSMGFLELIATLEDELGVEIDLSEDEPETYTSFGGLSDAVARHDAPA